MRFRLFLCLLLLAACDRFPKSAADADPLPIPTKGMGGRSVLSKTPAPPASSTTHNAVILGGIYQGMLPCADCAGIETVLYLYPDSTYLERRTYLDQPTDSSGEQVSAGRWVQVSANLVRLTRPNPSVPTDFRMHAHSLQQLDLDGQEITGEMAERYHLARIGNF